MITTFLFAFRAQKRSFYAGDIRQHTLYISLYLLYVNIGQLIHHWDLVTSSGNTISSSGILNSSPSYHSTDSCHAFSVFVIEAESVMTNQHMSYCVVIKSM